ncbi:MAG: signal recognition particle receptor subunit alpha, partial [Candidatus Binatia bacterium]
MVPGAQSRRGSETHPYIDSRLSDASTKQASWQRGLSRLRRVLVTPLDQLFRGQPLSEEAFTALEEALLGADVGVQTTTDLINRLRERCRRERPTDADILKRYLKEEM